MGFNQHYTNDGTYTFNSLMTGMALAIYFEFTWSFVFLLVLCGIISFLISLWILNWAVAKGVPLLSWTFIIVTWLALLGASNFSAFQFIHSTPTAVSSSQLGGLAGAIDGWLNEAGIPDLIKIYFRSLGAIMFQYNTLAGILIFIGLLFYSRIATLLSVLGFFIGYLFYLNFEGDFTQLIFSYIGFNFILTSIALGGFFIVPHWKSFLLVAGVIPIMAILISALNQLIAPFLLPIFSLPFCIMVTLLILTLSLRVAHRGLILVTNQQFSPEENHYKTTLNTSRFGQQTYFHISLPFRGEWHISQGYNGGITHIGEWQHALDFDIVNHQNKSYNGEGFNLKDYLCYELPIIAPAAGVVFEVVSDVEENPVGGVNLEQNWGNTVIIKHGEGFYSKLSHLKTGTIEVKQGDHVAKGDFIGKLGNSGRSPEPHLHYQLQTTPFIGSKTLPYPISYYLKKNGNNYDLIEFRTPLEGEKIKNIDIDSGIKKAFNFIPGQALQWQTETGVLKWEVMTNEFGKAYIHCKLSNSTAYFTNDGVMFHFTDFFGNENSALFNFYLGCQKIMVSALKNVKVTDQVHIKYVTPKWTKWLHDFCAPFFHFAKGNYTSWVESTDTPLAPKEVKLQATINNQLLGKTSKPQTFQIQIKNGKITQFSSQKINITCID